MGWGRVEEFDRQWIKAEGEQLDGLPDLAEPTPAPAVEAHLYPS